MSSYTAHINDKGERQSVFQHCHSTADLAALFAEQIGMKDIAYTAGLVHDLGKYSDAFQKRINENGKKIDHSTAGAKEIANQSGNALMKNMIEAVVAGHHSGLLDTGSKYANENDGTLAWRLSKTVDDYSAFHSEIQIPQITVNRFYFPSESQEYLMLYASFMTRMLFSCLVDADFLDTEHFMIPGNRPTCYEGIDTLCNRMMSWLEKKGWRRNQDGLAGARSAILNTCIQSAKNPKGLYTLTVPTGGGKTVSSLAFALNHARIHKMDRIIYVIPYCSIIDQTMQIFKSILGDNNVLGHYSEADYSENGDEMLSKRLAAENWDMPVIVTTAVQFFESLYSNRTSKCRKLHNMANAVIVFDEAQTFPVEYLDSCAASIAQLVTNCGSTCVLCTATQPSLEQKFKMFDPSIQISELCPDASKYNKVFKRVNYRYIGKKSDEELEQLLQQEKECLCIVSTVRQAFNLYQAVKGQDGIYSLSTNMLPQDRTNTLNVVKERLSKNQKCILISTSVVEAGIDIDFPVVYRSYAGIDSMIQAGGRCNREGRRPLSESVVYLFDMDAQKYHLPSSMKRPMEEAEPYKMKDITDKEIEAEYFNSLYQDSNCDLQNIIGLLNTKDIRFKTAAERYHLIEDDTWTLYIPIDETSSSLIAKLEDGSQYLTRQEYRILGRYALHLYDTRIQQLLDSIVILDRENKTAVLANPDLYLHDCGLTFDSHEGDMICY